MTSSYHKVGSRAIASKFSISGIFFFTGSSVFDAKEVFFLKKWYEGMLTPQKTKNLFKTLVRQFQSPGIWLEITYARILILLLQILLKNWPNRLRKGDTFGSRKFATSTFKNIFNV